MVAAAVLLVPAPSVAQTTSSELKIHHVEYPSRLYGVGAVNVVIESGARKVECVAYFDGIPSGSGYGYTTARIANFEVLVTPMAGRLTIRCQNAQ